MWLECWHELKDTCLPRLTFNGDFLGSSKSSWLSFSSSSSSPRSTLEAFLAAAFLSRSSAANCASLSSQYSWNFSLSKSSGVNLPSCALFLCLLGPKTWMNKGTNYGTNYGMNYGTIYLFKLPISLPLHLHSLMNGQYNLGTGSLLSEQIFSWVSLLRVVVKRAISFLPPGSSEILQWRQGYGATTSWHELWRELWHEIWHEMWTWVLLTWFLLQIRVFVLLPLVLLERSLAVESSFSANITLEPGVTLLSRLSVHFPHVFPQIRLRGEDLPAVLTLFILLEASVTARNHGTNYGLNIGTKCDFVMGNGYLLIGRRLIQMKHSVMAFQRFVALKGPSAHRTGRCFMVKRQVLVLGSLPLLQNGMAFGHRWTGPLTLCWSHQLKSYWHELWHECWHELWREVGKINTGIIFSTTLSLTWSTKSATLLPDEDSSMMCSTSCWERTFSAPASGLSSSSSSSMPLSLSFWN